MKHAAAVLLVMLGLALPATPARAGSLSTTDIIKQTISAIPACFDWKPVGLCTWLKCSLTSGCTVKTTIKVRHYVADLVVAVYNDLDKHPLSDMRALLSPVQQSATGAMVSALSGGLLDEIGSQGGRTEDGGSIDAGEVYDRRNLFFRETDAIGNPTSLLLGIAANAADLSLAGNSPGLSGVNLELPDLSLKNLATPLSDTLASLDLAGIRDAFDGVDLNRLTRLLDGLNLGELVDMRTLLSQYDLCDLSFSRPATTPAPAAATPVVPVPGQVCLSPATLATLSEIATLIQPVDLPALTSLTGLDLSGLGRLTSLPAIVARLDNTTRQSTEAGLVSIRDALSGLDALQSLVLIADTAQSMTMLTDIGTFLDTAGFSRPGGLPGITLPDTGGLDLSGWSLPDMADADLSGIIPGAGAIDLDGISGLVSAIDPGSFAGLAGLDWIPSVADFICPGTATIPLFPHYQSSFDALVWRNFIPTEWIYPASWVPGMREIGSLSPLKPRWGNVHPRIGSIVHATEPIAAAVLAQRAGDIVTREGQPHIYIPTLQGREINRGGYRITLPPPLRENDAGTGTWQMLMPVRENTCAVFGDESGASPIGGWAGGKVSADGDYVWNLWRPYECCRRRGIALFDIDF
ncbi:MAG TPA: hypothetical protein ENJ05_09395 [Thiotrichales bacterium]|nr:hypothetical protein [Thiotrichales bacterium]